MAGCAKEPYRDSAVEESVATKDAPHTLDVFHIAFAPGADETERTFSWHTRGMNKKGVVELSQLDEEGNVLSSETFEAAGEGILRGFSSFLLFVHQFLNPRFCRLLSDFNPDLFLMCRLLC